MRNINELIGIIKGINYDGVINDKEVVRLLSWVDKNRNLAFKQHQTELIKLVDNVLEDKIITDDERYTLLAYSERFLKETADSNARIYELNGIVEGIVCDGEVNEAEVYRLKKWMDVYGDSIKGHKTSEVLCKIVEDILEDKIITEEEQGRLLQMLTARISESQFETKLEYLRKQVRAKKSIGIDLIDILDKEDAMDEIHKQAESQLRNALYSYSGSYLTDPEVVVISLVLIAMLEYDGTYYENVRKTYLDLYSRFSEQKVEGLIRSILNRYRSTEEISSRTRIINFVLENAIVPSHFLAAFFEFIHDIYKLNFEYDLPEDPYEDFKFVYEGLRNSMLSEGDDLQINVTQKTYKLIKSTKKLIADEKYLESVIKLSIIVANLIDKKIWNKDVKIYNPYLSTGFGGWVEGFKDKSAGRRGQRSTYDFRSRWESKIILDSNQTYLVSPIHKVKAQYNYRDIRVVVSNGHQTIYENTQPDIREIIGGYQVSIDKIKISNPLGQVTYRLMASDEVIYDSKDKLHRSFIVFCTDGCELQNNTDYEGTAVFCYQNDHNKLKPFYYCEQYKLASQNVKYADTYMIEDTVFNFSSLIRPGIFGEEYENYYLLCQEDESEICVYKRVKFLVFESDNTSAKYEIDINGIRQKLSDYHFTVSEREGVCKYVIDLDIKDPGIYSVSVNQLSSGKKIKIAAFELAYDPGLVLDELKLDDNTYMVVVKTDLCSSAISVDINLDNFSEKNVQFKYHGKLYSYCIPFHFDIYRVSDGNWQPMSKPMWIGDISQDSVLDIYGTEIDGLIVYANTGTLLQKEINFNVKGVFRQAAIGFLVSYKVSYDYVMLGLTKDGKVQKAIFCYNKCILNENETEMNFDSVKKSLSITTVFHGKGNVFYEIINADGNSIYKSGYLKSGDIEDVDGLNSFEKYSICFYEKPKGLMIKKNQLMKKYDKIFYAREDFVGRSFKIIEVYFNQLVRGEFLEKSHYLNRIFVYFKKKISDDIFLGEVYARTIRGDFMLGKINPVDIEICSEVIDGTMDLYITKDGDGLLLDFERHGIMNTLDDNSATDIFSYTIDANGVNRFEEVKSDRTITIHK